MKNGTFILTNEVVEIAFLDPTLTTIDPSVQYTGIVNRKIPQKCDIEVLKDTTNLFLVLVWAIVMVKKKYAYY